jgi:hypothetical protein
LEKKWINNTFISIIRLYLYKKINKFLNNLTVGYFCLK